MRETAVLNMPSDEDRKFATDSAAMLCLWEETTACP